MAGWWTTEVLKAAAEREAKARVDHLAIALMLDAAHVPLDLTNGISAILTGNACDEIDVLKVVERFGPSFDRASADPDPGSLLLATGYHPRATAAAIAAGCRLMYVVRGMGAIQERMAAEVQVKHPLALDDDVIHEVLDHVYGRSGLRSKLKVAAEVDVDDVVFSCQKPTRKEAIERLRLLAPPETTTVLPDEVTKEMPPVAEKPAEPKPQASVVKKLSDMHGFGPDATAWGMNLARDLAAYSAGEIAWRDVDRGVLLSGPPGCGKTTYAQCLALECGVPLVSTTYSEWSALGGSVGDSMTKGMNKLFERWREKAKVSGPFILFWDEADSIGRRGGNDHNESWFSAIINALLAFLDGAVPRDGIVMVAATNHPERMDPALLRPGRLDRHVALSKPGVDALAGIVAGHMHDGGEVTDADRVAGRALRGRSPAEVELSCREARRVGRLLGRVADGQDVADVVAFTRPKRRPEMDRRVTIHEVAHAVVAHVLGTDHVTALDADDDLERTMAGGVQTATPAMPTRTQAVHRLAHCLAGRTGERLLLGEHSGGCHHDVSQATDLAHRVEFRYAMGTTLAALSGDVPLDNGRIGRVEALMREGDALAEAVLVPRRWHVDRLATILSDVRYMEGWEFREAYRIVGVQGFMGPEAEERAYREFAEAA